MPPPACCTSSAAEPVYAKLQKKTNPNQTPTKPPRFGRCPPCPRPGLDIGNKLVIQGGGFLPLLLPRLGGGSVHGPPPPLSLCRRSWSTGSIQGRVYPSFSMSPGGRRGDPPPHTHRPIPRGCGTRVVLGSGLSHPITSTATRETKPGGKKVP